MTDTGPNVTQLLHAVAAGDRSGLDDLLSAIYADLRRLASAHMDRERASHTLQPTAVVHEAYLRLIDQRSATWNDRVHFFAVASTIIRRILVDHARERNALKRGGGERGSARRLALEEVEAPAGMQTDDLEALDAALKELATLNERQSRIVELRFFAGLTIDEVAGVMNMGKRSVDRDWRVAKAWLFTRLSDAEAGPLGGAGGRSDGP
jgi:RNA polymerase sigma factor (TIGR02999 family)